MGNTGTPKRDQHWLPRTYLKKFSIDNKKKLVHIFDCESKCYHESHEIKTLCKKRHLHEVVQDAAAISPDDRFYRYNKVEDGLADFEDQISTPYQKLLESCGVGLLVGHQFERGIAAMCALAANIAFRQPEAVEEYKDIGANVAMRMPYHTLTSDDQQVLAYGGITEADYAQALATSSLEMALYGVVPGTPCHAIARKLLGMGHTILEAPKGCPFVTTSFPFLFEYSGSGFVNDIEFIEHITSCYFPISSYYAILFSGSESPVLPRKLETGDVTKYNIRLLNGADWGTAICCDLFSLTAAVRFSRVWRE